MIDLCQLIQGTLIFLVCCLIIKPFRGIPKALWNALGDLIRMVVDIFIGLLQQLILFLREAIPLLMQKLFQVLLAVVMTVVKALGWLLEQLIRLLHGLFQRIGQG